MLTRGTLLQGLASQASKRPASGTGEGVAACGEGGLAAAAGEMESRS